MVGDKPFRLFLRLIVELVNNGGDGCVYKIDLIEDGFLISGKTAQEILRLQNPFKSALKGLDSKEFI